MSQTSRSIVRPVDRARTIRAPPKRASSLRHLYGHADNQAERRTAPASTLKDRFQPTGEPATPGE